MMPCPLSEQTLGWFKNFTTQTKLSLLFRDDVTGLMHCLEDNSCDDASGGICHNDSFPCLPFLVMKHFSEVYLKHLMFVI